MIDPLPAGCRLTTLPVRGDARGSLIAIESNREAPFDLNRVFYIYGTDPAAERGHHAHHKFREIAIAVAGACIMSLDDGTDRVDVRLDDPAKALTIAPSVWRVMKDFSSDCILLVLTDAPYDESDYIRDYAEFLRITRA